MLGRRFPALNPLFDIGIHFGLSYLNYMSVADKEQVFKPDEASEKLDVLDRRIRGSYLFFVLALVGLGMFIGKNV